MSNEWIELTISAGTTLNIASGALTTVPFDQIVGGTALMTGAYNTTTYQFTPPVNGVYVMECTIRPAITENSVGTVRYVVFWSGHVQESTYINHSPYALDTQPSFSNFHCRYMYGSSDPTEVRFQQDSGIAWPVGGSFTRLSLENLPCLNWFLMQYCIRNNLCPTHLKCNHKVNHCKKVCRKSRYE